MLEVRNLCYERDERCLFNNLQFKLAEGQLLQVAGANGSGKTTLLKILAGLLLPTEGEIIWQQQQIQHSRHQFYQALLYLGHLPGINLQLTPKENLNFFAKLNAIDVSERELAQALENMGLNELVDVPCYLLSAGQQRRVTLTRLFCSRAKLWILDEPLTALDQQGIKLIEQLVARHLAQQGMVIITSHQPLSTRSIVAKEIQL